MSSPLSFAQALSMSMLEPISALLFLHTASLLSPYVLFVLLLLLFELSKHLAQPFVPLLERL